MSEKTLFLAGRIKERKVGSGFLWGGWMPMSDVRTIASVILSVRNRQM